MEPVAGALALASAALFAGAALYVSLVEHPARIRAGISTAIAEFRPSYRRAAPLMGGLAIISLAAGLTAAVTTARWPWAVGAVAVGIAVPYTLLVIMPTNRQLLAPEFLGQPEAARLLDRWGRLHWVRSVLGLGGLAAYLAAAFTR